MAPATRITRMKLRWRHLGGALLGLAVAGVGLWLMRRGAHSQEIERGPDSEARKQPGLTVDVVRPRSGGISRTIQQPASIHSFESVELYAMVSGYLKKQDVDIGSRIKKGEVLAEINVPRDAKAVEEAASLMEHARAQVVQAQARIKVTVAQQDTAAVSVKAAECDLTRLVSRRELCSKAVSASQRPGCGESG